MSPDLDALIAEATVDCYGDDEQLACLFTMIDENIGAEPRISLLDLPLADPSPKGAEWVEPYRRWAEAVTCRRAGRDEDDNDRLLWRAAVGRAAVSATVLAMLASGCAAKRCGGKIG